MDTGLEQAMFRLQRLERDVEALRAEAVSERVLTARLETIRAEINNVKTSLEHAALRLEAAAAESTQRRLLLYGAVVTAIGSLVVSLLLGGG
jgi:hypothetical protein